MSESSTSPAEIQEPDGRVTFSLSDLPALDVLESEWRGMGARESHSFFLSWSWIGTWLSLQSSNGSKIFVLRAKRNNHSVGIALLSIRRSIFRGLIPVSQAWLNAAGDDAIDSITVEHNGFASTQSSSESFWVDFADWIGIALPADEIIIPGISLNEPLRSDKLIITDRRSIGYRTPLETLKTRDGINAILSRNSRQQLRRSIRSYERDGILRLQSAESLSTALEYFENMKMLHALSWSRRGKRHAFSQPFFELFHRALISNAWDEGGVELLRISAGDKPLGYLYNFVQAGTVSSYQSGFEYTNTGARPGYLCHALAMQYYANKGLKYYDFLAGTNQLKQTFATERYELSSLGIRKPIMPFRLEHFMRKLLHRSQ